MQVSMGTPLLPLPECDEDDDDNDDEQHSSHKKKSDWLTSVQLWNPNPQPFKEDVPRKTNVVEVKRTSGAFQPFHREGKGNSSEACKAPTSQQVPATSSTEPVVESSSKREDKGQRKQRRCWSQELHKHFLHALQQVGGSNSATPKQIRELMKVDSLTNDEVKSIGVAAGSCNVAITIYKCWCWRSRLRFFDI